MALNLSSAAASPGFLSGWYCLASLRYARFISASEASFETSSVRYGSSGTGVLRGALSFNLMRRCSHRCANHQCLAGDAMGVGWAVFRNYAGHAQEILGDVTDYPRFFLMPPSAMVEASTEGANVVTLLEPDEHIDHEVEMVFRIGDDLSPIQMCVGIDTTNRTRQTMAKKEGWPWLEGKGFRGSGVLGTWSDWDGRDVEICLSINGETRQRASTKLMVHPIDSLMSHLTNWYDLEPGDLVWTGTPKGVGQMKPGDIIDAWMKNSEGETISVLNAVCE